MIKTINGHLTALDKKVIAAILAAGGLAAKTPKKRYFLSPDDSGWKVQIKSNESNDFGVLVERTRFARFSVIK
jgi:hypothetical protein